MEVVDKRRGENTLPLYKISDGQCFYMETPDNFRIPSGFYLMVDRRYKGRSVFMAFHLETDKKYRLDVGYKTVKPVDATVVIGEGELSLEEVSEHEYIECIRSSDR